MDVMRHGRGMTLTNGNALAGRLAKSAFDLKIPLWLSSPVRELIVENGAVRGAMVEREGRLVRVNARRGVVLACGGFPHDVDRRKEMFPARADRQRAFFARPDRQHRRRPAAGGSRRRSRRGHAAECGGLGAGLDHDAQGRQQGRDAAFHRPRQARRDRGDARRQALCQRRQFLPRFRAGHDEGRQARRGDRGLPDLRPSRACANTASAACRRFRCRFAITCAPAISCAARRWPNSRHEAGIDAKGLEATVARFNADGARGAGSRVRQGLARL